MIYFSLFTAFFKTGLFAIGGGLATLPFLYEISDRYGWFTKEMLSDMLAVSESTPGPIGVNMATYAGYCAAGVPGAIVATFSLILPSVIIILLIATFMSRFRENRFVKSAFCGIRPAVVAIVALAVWKVLQVSVLNMPRFLETQNFFALFEPLPILLLGGFLFVNNFFKKVHPIFLIAAGAILGILLNL